MSKFTIIGSGALGTAFAKILYDANQKDVVIYGVEEKEISELKRGQNTRYFPQNILLPQFNATTNLEEALLETDYVVMAVPSVVFPIILEKINAFVGCKKPLIISGSKGFYPGTNTSLHQGTEDFIAANHNNFRGVVSTVGPSFAIEMVKESPTMICAVSENKQFAQEVQQLFQTKYMTIYTQTDVIGAEIGSAYKNIMAIAAGITVELGYEINTIASLLTRGLDEMLEFVKISGGQPKTVIGLTGVGDMLLTSMSDKSRNRQFGRDVIRKGASSALETKVTVEGVQALKAVYKIANDKKLNLPIVKSLYKIIFEGDKPESLIQNIFSPKSVDE